jgi:heat shock protein HtpX
MEREVVSSFLDEATRREHKLRNLVQSALLLGGLGALLAIAAWLVWGWVGILWAAAAILVVLSLAPHVPPQAVMRMYRAQEVAPHQGGPLGDIVTILAERAELPARPRLFVIPSATLNAFATGRPEHAAIALTEGLLRCLTVRELAGVLAHEISHIRNNDLWVMGLADAINRFTTSLSYVAVLLAIFNGFGLLAGELYVSWWAVLVLYLAPTVSSLLQLALSRAREYDADLEGAWLTGDPVGIASALRKLERYTGSFWEDLMFPVPGRRIPNPSLLRSHPSTEERVARLLQLDPRSTRPLIGLVDEPLRSLYGGEPIAMRPRYRWPGVWY